MTKLSSTSEKPPAQEVVHMEDEDDSSSESDDDLKKNIYNEIPEYDDVDEVKLAVSGLKDVDDVKLTVSGLDNSSSMDAVLRQQNLANENLYSEIRPNDERFENALYMEHEKQREFDEGKKQQKSNLIIGGGAVFPSMSPKTRSFFPAAPLPSIPSSQKVGKKWKNIAEIICISLARLSLLHQW